VSALSDIWGVGQPGLSPPSGPPAYAFLLLVAALLLGVLYQTHAPALLRAMSRRQWLALGGLCLAALLLSQLVPLRLPWSNPLLQQHPATAYLMLLAAVPPLLAGATLNVPAAVLVGLFAGLGRAIGQTGAPGDILAAGLAAGVAAWLMQQNYAGRLFATLRRPVVAGVLGRLLWAVVIVLDIVTALAPQATFLGALDLGLFIGLHAALPLALEGALGGLLVSLILWIAPHWRPDHGLVPSPLRRTLQRQLTTAFLSFAAAILLLSALVAFVLSARAARTAVAENIAADAQAVAMRLGTLQTDLAATLAEQGADPALAAADPQLRSSALGRLRAAAPQFSDIKLVSGATAISATTDPAALTPAEGALVSAALAAGQARYAVAPSTSGPQVTVALPRPGSANAEALLGTLAPAVLGSVAGELGIDGLVVDEASQVVVGAGGAAGDWQAPTADQQRLTLPGGRPVYETLNAAGARQLVAYTLVPESGWKVVTVAPQALILRRALGIMGPLSLLLLAVSGLFFVYVSGLGRAIARPIGEISQASRAIAGGGGLERPVRSQREDEIGQLSLAFSQMQRALRQRLDELSLLLSVSNDVAATVNLSDGMTAVLQGVLRGTGAAGARAVIRNPNGPAPLVFAQGPAAEAMATLDRAVVRRMRADDELGLTAPAAIEAELTTAPPVAALFALPLRLAGEYQGALYLGYRQPHYFDSDERNLLRTLAGQASVLVQNAYLFAAAEGGRRRLAAVLASTPNAVLVTDQTDRVLLVNPAMEAAFSLRAADTIGRPVTDALAAGSAGPELARRLTTGPDGAERKLELTAGDRDFLAAVSTVHTSDGQAIGRVAVLQDVTDLKEVDRLKSEFLDGISHDLRSPLTYMRNYAGLLPLPEDPAREQEYVNKIVSGIDRMSVLVEGLLEMANLRAGTGVQFDRVDVGELLSEVAQEYASPAWMRGVRLVVETDGDRPPVKADPTLLRRAMTNLLTNALKYAPESGPVVLRAEASGDEVVLSVRDRGPGIAAAELPYVFQKFYRGGQANAGRPSGSGLGLAIVKSIADLHDGRVWCESAPGEGSTFYIALPAVRSKAL
jgi:two-component system NtrC family sensor kinase